jgi:hypothetical protein
MSMAINELSIVIQTANGRNCYTRMVYLMALVGIVMDQVLGMAFNEETKT